MGISILPTKGGESVKVKDNPDILKNEKSFEERAKELEQEKKAEEERRKEDNKSNFSRWSQYNLEHTSEMIILASNYPKAHAILLFLIDNMDNTNSVMCSYQVFQELLNVSKDTVRIAIKVLKEKNLIHVWKSGSSNVYCVNPDVHWKSYGKNIKSCKFPTNVILSFEEQEECYKVHYESIRSVTLEQDKERRNQETI